MLFTYPTIVHKEDNSYWVEFPDLEGCQTFADTLNEAIINSQEALSAYLSTMLETGYDFCPPSDVLQITVDNNSFTNLVSCEINDRALELNINLTYVTLV